MTTEECAQATPPSCKIWVDGDACPIAVRDIIFKAAKRRQIKTIVVANASVRIPSNPIFRLELVPSGADKADKRIVELLRAGDLVITADIPLAAAVVEKGAVAIGPRGEMFDADSVGERLATRNMMEHMRAAGLETSGPRPQSQKNVQAFANQLDRTLTKMIR